MSTPKRTFAERMKTALADRPVSEAEVVAERAAETVRVRRALRHFDPNAAVLRPGEGEAQPRRRRALLAED